MIYRKIYSVTDCSYTIFMMLKSRLSWMISKDFHYLRIRHKGEEDVLEVGIEFQLRKCLFYRSITYPVCIKASEVFKY